MEHLHLNLDNVHCKDCEEKIYATFNKFFKTIRLDDKWSEEVDIPFNNENTVFTHIKGGKVDLYYKPKVDSVESTLQIQSRGSRSTYREPDLMFYRGNFIKKENWY